MTTSDPCIFCAIAAGEAPASVVLETDAVLAFMDVRQPNPGHVLVIPRRHLADVRELDDATAAELMPAIAAVSRAVDQVFAPDGMNVSQSTGEAGGQEVFHLHFHVLTRRHGDRLFRVYDEGGPPASTPRAALDEYALSLRRAIRPPGAPPPPESAQP